MCFSILWKLHANIKLHLPKKMFHQIQKFPTLYLQANIHTLQKILTCLKNIYSVQRVQMAHGYMKMLI